MTVSRRTRREQVGGEDVIIADACWFVAIRAMTLSLCSLKTHKLAM